jgi:uncharacterized protein YggU (UPF0235/DUF167 family)
MDSSQLEIRETAGGSRLRVRVRPGGRRNAIVAPHGGALKVTVTAAPERGRANEAVAVLLARALGISRGRVRIVAGHSSPDKTLAVEGMDPSTIREAIARLDGLDR